MRSRIEQATLVPLANFGEQVVPALLKQSELADLQPPQAVLDATAAYLESEDAIAAWIDDKCERDARAWEQSSDLFASWSGWAEKAGEPVGTMRRFSQTLESRGFVPQRRKNGRGFGGLRVLQSSSWEER